MQHTSYQKGMKATYQKIYQDRYKFHPNIYLSKL